METLVEIAKRLGINPNAGYTSEQLKDISKRLMDEMQKLFKGEEWRTYASLDDAVYRLHKKVPAPENLEETKSNILFLKENSKENIRIHGQNSLPVSKEEDATFVWHSAKDRKKLKERFQIAIQMDHPAFRQMVEQLDKFIVKHRSAFKMPDIDHVDRSDCLNVYMGEKITPEIAKELYEIVAPCLDTKYADHLDGLPILNEGKEIQGIKMVLEPQKPDLDAAKAIRDKFNIKNDLPKPFLRDLVNLGPGAIQALYAESAGEMASRIQVLDLAYYLAGKEGKNPMSMSNYYGQEGVQFSAVDISQETEHTHTEKGEQKMTPEEATEQLKTLRDWTSSEELKPEEWQKIKESVEAGADVNTVLSTEDNLTLAHLAAAYGDKDFIQSLDKKGIDWNQLYSPDDLKVTVAHLAAQYNDSEAVKFFIGKVDFSQKDKEGKTALDYIEDPAQKTEIEELIKTKKTAATEHLKSVLLAQNGFPEKSKLYDVTNLIKKGADVNAVLIDTIPEMDDKGLTETIVTENLTVAHWLAQYGDIETLKLADAKGIDWKAIHLPNRINETVLHMAAKAGNEVALKFFIEKGMDFAPKDNDGKTALEYVTDSAKKEELEKLIAKAEEEKAGDTDEGPSHPIDPNDNGERDEGEAHSVDPTDNGLDDEGETPDVPPVDEEGREPDPAPNGEEGKGKPAGTPQSKRIAGALKDATDNFFKAVFEGNHKTAEEFAQALLMNLLAFPLDAIGIYLEKKYDPDEKDLLKKILDEMQKNKENGGNGNGSNSRIEGLSEEDDKRFTNICRLNLLLKATNPDIYDQIAGKSPDEIKAFFESNQEALEKITASLGDIAKTAGGKGIISELFPDNYNGTISKEQLLEFLSGKANNGRGGNGGYASKDELIERMLGVIEKQAGQKVVVNNNLSNIGNPNVTISDIGKVNQNNVGNASIKGSGNSKAEGGAGGSTGAINISDVGKVSDVKGGDSNATTGTITQTASPTNTVNPTITVNPTVQGGNVSDVKATTGAMTQTGASADSHAQQTANPSVSQTGASATTGAMTQTASPTTTQTANPNVAPTITANPQQTAQGGAGGAGGSATVTDAAKTGSVTQSQDDNSSKGDSVRTNKSINVDGAGNTVLTSSDSTHKSTEVTETKEEQKEKLPFELPKKMSEENKKKIADAYQKILESEGTAENKAKKLSTFITKVGEKVSPLQEALNLIQKKKDLLDQVRLTKKGEIFKADEATIVGAGIDKETVKMALGLRKRLEEGSKAGGTPQSNTKGKGR